MLQNQQTNQNQVVATPVTELKLLNPDGSTASNDSIKLSLKSPRKEATYQLVINGDNAVKEITSEVINGTGTLTVNGLSSVITILPNGTYPVKWKPTALGKALLHFKMKDASKNIREDTIAITLIRPLAPAR